MSVSYVLCCKWIYMVFHLNLSLRTSFAWSNGYNMKCISVWNSAWCCWPIFAGDTTRQEARMMVAGILEHVHLKERILNFLVWGSQGKWLRSTLRFVFLSYCMVFPFQVSFPESIGHKMTVNLMIDHKA